VIQIHQNAVTDYIGIQKRAEQYSDKNGVHVCCHQLFHTMAADLLNAGADIVTIQCLLGHGRIKTTLRYVRLSNRRARIDYYQAMSRIIEVKARWPCGTSCVDQRRPVADAVTMIKTLTEKSGKRNYMATQLSKRT